MKQNENIYNFILNITLHCCFLLLSLSINCDYDSDRSNGCTHVISMSNSCALGATLVDLVQCKK